MYTELKNEVLRLYPTYNDLGPSLTISHENKHTWQSNKLNLWGTIGSGKSYMLAALCCNLYSVFSMSSPQVQRVVYVPDCQCFLQQPEDTMLSALRLAYSNAKEKVYDMLFDDKKLDMDSIKDFFEREARKRICLYLVLDNYDALQPDNDDSSDKKYQIVKWLKRCAYQHICVQSASANNQNCKVWMNTSRLQSEAAFWCHGGLNENEYVHFKKHFSLYNGRPSSLSMLDGNEEMEHKVKFDTGCVPLFLSCWMFHSSDDGDPWQKLFALKEIQDADLLLSQYMEDQLNNNHADRYLNMYMHFLLGRQVAQDPSNYDCRYMYKKNGIGKVVCGIFMKLMAQVLQKFQHKNCCVQRWHEAVYTELLKHEEDIDYSLLDFMIEQHVISTFLKDGVKFYNIMYHCEHLEYFNLEEEEFLYPQKGCTLYVPHVFNYTTMDCVVRYIGRPPRSNKQLDLDLLNSYSELEFHVIGIRITYGNLKRHLKSEQLFFSPQHFRVWCKLSNDIIDTEEQFCTIAKLFLWVARKEEVVKLGEMHNRLQYGPIEVDSIPFLQTGKETKTSSVQSLKHVTMFEVIEEIYPEVLRRE